VIRSNATPESYSCRTTGNDAYSTRCVFGSGRTDGRDARRDAQLDAGTVNDASRWTARLDLDLSETIVKAAALGS
jgi:hypothetical protein